MNIMRTMMSDCNLMDNYNECNECYYSEKEITALETELFELREKLTDCNKIINQMHKYNLSLTERCESAENALEFYGDTNSMSCRLRYKHEDTPKCLQGESDYYQDPADLPILQDGGTKAREHFSKYKGDKK